MGNSKTLNQKKLAVVGIFIAVVFLFSLNILSSLEIRTSQIDLTENKLYTLSEGTKEVIKDLSLYKYSCHPLNEGFIGIWRWAIHKH